MLRERFQAVILLAFLVFSLALASETVPDEDLPQCPVSPAASTSTGDDDGDDGAADDEAPCVPPPPAEESTDEDPQPMALSLGDDDDDDEGVPLDTSAPLSGTWIA